MSYKKEMSMLTSLSTEGRVVSVDCLSGSYVCTPRLWITKSYFTNPLVLRFISFLSEETIKFNEEHGNGLTYDKDFIESTIAGAIQNRFYNEDEFDRYEHGNICPQNELFGVPVKFFSSVAKLFPEKTIGYHYNKSVIVGMNMDSNEVLFVYAGFSMPKQQTLLDFVAE